eukprot:11555735-Alexandrium_andersonii.AAC.1
MVWSCWAVGAPLPEGLSADWLVVILLGVRITSVKNLAGCAQLPFSGRRRNPGCWCSQLTTTSSGARGPTPTGGT